MQITRKDLKDLEVQFTVSADKDEIEDAKQQALKELGKEINVPGFRKGKAPANEIKKRVGELRILQEALEVLVDKGFRQVLSENEDLTPITQPSIDIQDEEKFIAAEASLEFTITVTNRPEVTLPDYKNLDTTYQRAEVSDEDVEQAVADLFERWKETQKQDETPTIETASTLTEAEQKSQNSPNTQNDTQENLVALSKENPDDEWAQSLGANDMLDLKQKLRANLALEKTYEAGNKFTQEILDKLYQKTKIKLPQKLIEGDLEHRKKNKQEDLEKVGLDLEGFAKQQKISVDELEKQWLEDIEKEYALEFAIDTIGNKEDVTVSDEEVEAEIKASQSAEALKLFQDDARKERLRHLMRRDKIIGKLVEWNFPEDIDANTHKEESDQDDE